MTAALVVLGGYLLGSMPFGYWFVKLVKGEDIRNVGSGNIGATNVWRAYGRWYGIPIVLLDVAKGLVPGVVGAQLVGELVGVLAGGAAMLGHWRPLFLRFQKGGKTVATAGGTFFGVATLLGLIGLGIWILVFLLSRYASLASIVTALSLPLLGLVLGEPWPVIVFASIAAVVVLLLHKANIARLRAGTESRFALRRGSAA
ncbi:MAG TPA: glycerol-3-phosphate 1-O-acyltransferase PlsY [Gaiellaceae bacterium]|nr:glycerol-3-phosphate 1-O-acyltransferase PlsY [Gaiellaceae bacterium]